jgi:protein SCO1/2
MTPEDKLRRQLLALMALAPLLPVGAAHAAGIADVSVRDQDGRALRFQRDLVQGRVVAINFVFTGCSAVCPLMGANFASVQQLLGDRLPQAALISVSIDPLNDTPARLREWRDKFSTKQGWTLVTGRKSDMDRLLQSLGAAAPDPGSHAPFILIVDGINGSPWMRMDGLADPAKVAAALRQRAGQV